MKKADFNRIYPEYLKSDDWRAKRAIVLERDNNTCQACLRAPATQVHHKSYERVFDEPLFDLESVCDECHGKIHDKRTDAERAKKYMPSGMSVSVGRGRNRVTVVKEENANPTEEQSMGWFVGSKAYHREYGDGIIQRVRLIKGDLVLDILFDSGRMGRFLPYYTPIARTKDEYDAMFDTSEIKKMYNELMDSFK